MKDDIEITGYIKEDPVISNKAKVVAILGAVIVALIPITHFMEHGKAGKMEREVCSNFKTQAEAQERFDRYISTEYGIYVSKLDGDKDGVVCEHLPLK